MKPSKKKPAKRAVRTGSTEHKLMRLRNRIDDVYHLIKEGNGKPKFDLTMLGDTRIDRQWVETLISDIRNKMFTKLCKEDFEKCNGLWRQYA